MGDIYEPNLIKFMVFSRCMSPWCLKPQRTQQQFLMTDLLLTLVSCYIKNITLPPKMELYVTYSVKKPNTDFLQSCHLLKGEGET